MGQACCSYEPKDKNNENFADGSNKTIMKKKDELYILQVDQV